MEKDLYRLNFPRISEINDKKLLFGPAASCVRNQDGTTEIE